MGHELINFFIDVENHRNGNNEYNHENIGAQKLLDDISIQTFNCQWIISFYHNLLVTFSIIFGFHVEKFPAIMCCRASSTSHM